MKKNESIWSVSEVNDFIKPNEKFNTCYQNNHGPFQPYLVTLTEKHSPLVKNTNL